MTMRKTLTRCLAGALFAFVLAACGEKAAPPPPAPKVTVAHPEERELVDQDEYTGWLEAAETVEVRARVRGHIAKIHFTDGQIVKKGDLLFEIDPRPFQAELQRAREQLKAFEAQRVAAEKEDIRLKSLFSKGAVSQREAEKAEAQVRSLEAQIGATQEEITRRELDLQYSRITAPIGGRISRALLTVGNLVQAGGTDPLLTTIVSIDPIYLYFNIDERSVQRYQQRHPPRPGGTLKDARFPFHFGLDTDEGYPHEGVLDFAENRVDRETGTIQVRGVVRNPKARFVSGSRVRVRLPVSDPYKAILVPDTAVLTDQDKKYLLVVDDKSVVQRRDVKPGKLLEDGMRLVLPGDGESLGLKQDDWVIILGLQRARVNYPVEALDASGNPIAQRGAAEIQSAPAGKPH
jgi:RND family efflux transporter MFP subunit